ncbi:Glycosyltransferase involved in cell wall bisynthesis [Marinobacter gudaonensis]|uniref:Glycosyltransferase involved in cell wall bisynthesis n=1 Tax=Marinobacter gudaonensis TaxID=375760 RepID=A0A1I6GJ31_9GAMM|nr:glycosyltransferase family 4 protein [Marinobacter gudaonensis]SFR42205.1 Glycosyltransferase involved in cell wall bisynthesis [Marinobacter gudaonensis]
MAQIAMFVWNDFRNDARVKNEALSLASAGHSVTVHALFTDGVTPHYEEVAAGVAVKRHGRKQGIRLAKPRVHTAKRSGFELGMLLVSRVLTHLVVMVSIVKERPDVVHAHDVNVLPTAWLAARLCGAKLVYDAHEISSGREGYRKIGRLVAWIEKKIMPRAAGTITTTDARAKFFARAYGIARPLVLQNRPRLVSVPGDDRIRKMLGLSADRPIVIYQGGQQPGRGLERLVACAARVPNAHFVFVGGGSLHEDLKQLAEQLSLTDRVFFIPTVPLAELPFFTASADIGVQPIENTCLNHFTTDSNKLFEYVVARLPVIASDLPEIARVVRAHDLGLLVKPGDSDALVDALNRLVDAPELRSYYSGRAEQAASTLNWEEQEQSLVAMYERILSRTPE